MLAKTSSFRKISISWYDSDNFCFFLIVFLIGIGIFASVGISVAEENVLYNDYVWLPYLILLSSCYVIISLLYRMIRRKIMLKKEKLETSINDYEKYGIS